MRFSLEVRTLLKRPDIIPRDNRLELNLRELILELLIQQFQLLDLPLSLILSLSDRSPQLPILSHQQPHCFLHRCNLLVFER